MPGEIGEVGLKIVITNINDLQAQIEGISDKLRNIGVQTGSREMAAAGHPEMGGGAAGAWPRSSPFPGAAGTANFPMNPPSGAMAAGSLAGAGGGGFIIQRLDSMRIETVTRLEVQLAQSVTINGVGAGGVSGRGADLRPSADGAPTTGEPPGPAAGRGLDDLAQIRRGLISSFIHHAIGEPTRIFANLAQAAAAGSAEARIGGQMSTIGGTLSSLGYGMMVMGQPRGPGAAQQAGGAISAAGTGAAMTGIGLPAGAALMTIGTLISAGGYAAQTSGEIAGGQGVLMMQASRGQYGWGNTGLGTGDIYDQARRSGFGVTEYLQMRAMLSQGAANPMAPGIDALVQSLGRGRRPEEQRYIAEAFQGMQGIAMEPGRSSMLATMLAGGQPFTVQQALDEAQNAARTGNLTRLFEIQRYLNVAPVGTPGMPTQQVWVEDKPGSAGMGGIMGFLSIMGGAGGPGAGRMGPIAPPAGHWETRPDPAAAQRELERLIREGEKAKRELYESQIEEAEARGLEAQGDPVGGARKAAAAARRRKDLYRGKQSEQDRLGFAQAEADQEAAERAVTRGIYGQQVGGLQSATDIMRVQQQEQMYRGNRANALQLIQGRGSLVNAEASVLERELNDPNSRLSPEEKARLRAQVTQLRFEGGLGMRREQMEFRYNWDAGIAGSQASRRMTELQTLSMTRPYTEAGQGVLYEQLDQGLHSLLKAQAAKLSDMLKESKGKETPETEKMRATMAQTEQNIQQAVVARFEEKYRIQMLQPAVRGAEATAAAAPLRAFGVPGADLEKQQNIELQSLREQSAAAQRKIDEARAKFGPGSYQELAARQEKAGIDQMIGNKPLANVMEQYGYTSRISQAQAQAASAETQQQLLSGRGGADIFRVREGEVRAAERITQQAETHYQQLAAMPGAAGSAELAEADAARQAARTREMNLKVQARGTYQPSVQQREAASAASFEIDVLSQLPFAYGNVRGAYQRRIGVTQQQISGAEQQLAGLDMSKPESAESALMLRDFIRDKQRSQVSDLLQLSQGWEGRIISQMINAPSGFNMATAPFSMMNSLIYGGLPNQFGHFGGTAGQVHDLWTMPGKMRLPGRLPGWKGMIPSEEGFGVFGTGISLGPGGAKDAQKDKQGRRAAGEAPVEVTGKAEIVLRLPSGTEVGRGELLLSSASSSAAQNTSGGVDELYRSLPWSSQNS